MATIIVRDPFARATLMRANRSEIHANRDKECRECGGPARFAYRWEADRRGPNREPWIGMFCSVGCYRSWMQQ